MKRGLTNHSRVSRVRRKSTKTVRSSELPHNLRKFRKKLALSQEAFGTRFGGYTRRQINSYETGESEIPIGLLLAIRNRGYPLDVVIGPKGQADLMAEVIGYVPHLLKIHAAMRRLTEELLKTLQQEDKRLTNMLHRRGLPS